MRPDSVQVRDGIGLKDPPPTTPFDVVLQTARLRLRRYRLDDHDPDGPPILLVYALVKRPFILDLLPERSVVRSLLRGGHRVYLTDWVPPGKADANWGLREYVDDSLLAAIRKIQEIEQVASVSLIGGCCGGLLAAVYAALYPSHVASLVTFATPFDAPPPVDRFTASAVCNAYGNVPAWMVRSAMNVRVRNVMNLPDFLAAELGEPSLAELDWEQNPELLVAVQQWLDSDVPVAGRVFLDVVCDLLGRHRLLDGRLSIGDRRVDPGRIRCPVLSIAGETDVLVPPREVAPFAAAVGSDDVTEWVFPCGHLGLMLGHEAHRSLWPGVAAWLRRAPDATPGQWQFPHDAPIAGQGLPAD